MSQMLLVTLKPRLIKHIGPDPYEGSRDVESRLDADGVRFLCPVCYHDPPVGEVGTHVVICWFYGRVPDDMSPGPGRWVPSGEGLGVLTLGARPGGSDSVKLEGGCGAHFRVRDGVVDVLPDRGESAKQRRARRGTP